MKKQIFLTTVNLILLLFTSCFDFERKNPFDPNNEDFSYELKNPYNLIASDSLYEDKVVLNWQDDNMYVDSYLIYRADDKDSEYIEVGKTNNKNYEDYNVVRGQFYYYKIKVFFSMSKITGSEFSNINRGNSSFQEYDFNNIKFVKINNDFFNMGVEDIVEPVHIVTLSTDYYISKYEITNSLWNVVYTWAVNNGYTFSNNSINSDDKPVTSINWYDAIKWCNALSEMSGRTPPYYTDSLLNTVYRQGELDIDNNSVNWSSNGFRLPTEAEWEFACKTKEDYYYYWGNNNTFEIVDQFIWYVENSKGLLHPVGAKYPNAFGLYDMIGNVREWCWDWYDTYSYLPSTDPRGPIGSYNYKVIRGGSINSGVEVLFSSSRSYMNPSYQVSTIGFRIVLIE